MPKPNSKALQLWYADGRRDAAESYDADDFDLAKLAAAYKKAGGADPAAEMSAIAAAAYEEWFGKACDEGSEAGWRKQRRDLVQEAEEEDGIKAAEAYAAWKRGHHEVIVHNLSDDILLEAGETDDDDDEDLDDEAEEEEGDDEEDDDEDDDEEDDDEEE